MLKVDISQLATAIRTVAPFAFREISSGTQYIRDEICNCLASGKKVKFSEIDFSAFDMEDIDDLLDYQHEVDLINHKSGSVAQSLREIEPAVVSGIFV